MAIKTTIGFPQFVDAFRAYGREDQFSHDALRALYNYLEDYSDSTGEDVELDVIALCGEWSEVDDAQVGAEDFGIDLAVDPDDYDDDEYELECARLENLRDQLEGSTTALFTDCGSLLVEAF